MRRTPFLIRSLVIATLVLTSACGDDPAAPSPDAGHVPDPLIDERPYSSLIPVSYDPATPTPLVLILHGYSAAGVIQAGYFGFLAGAEEHGYLLAYPDGLVDSQGKQFWNATDACCNDDDLPVDDVAYLTAVIDDMKAQYNVDPRRVYLVGHSNGGYMAHRLACDIGDRVAAIVSVAGMTWKDPLRCPAAAKVNVLQVHGDVDDTVLYAGGGDYPSAPETVATWAAKNGCTGALVADGEPMDLEQNLAGAETSKQTYTGCPEGGDVDLWTMAGVGHIPIFHPLWEQSVWAYFEAHPKP